MPKRLVTVALAVALSSCARTSAPADVRCVDRAADGRGGQSGEAAMVAVLFEQRGALIDQVALKRTQRQALQAERAAGEEALLRDHASNDERSAVASLLRAAQVEDALPELSPALRENLAARSYWSATQAIRTVDGELEGISQEIAKVDQALQAWAKGRLPIEKPLGAPDRY